MITVAASHLHAAKTRPSKWVEIEAKSRSHNDGDPFDWWR
jgi:hypothetical protein